MHRHADAVRDRLVAPQIAHVAEWLAARAASERCLARMHTQVPHQRHSLIMSERFGAHRTGEGFFARVDPHMALDRRAPALQRFAADLARDVTVACGRRHGTEVRPRPSL